MINCTINGRALSVPEGTRIIEAAEQVGVGIPYYCYHPALSAPAMCRMCLVEVQGAPKLQPACVTNVMEGNVILTESEKAREARTGTLEFYLVNHPLDCPICDAAGECKLQDYVYLEGRKHGRSSEPKRVLGQDDFGGDILYDGDRCIMCTRCVRFMREIAGNDALCVVQRGHRSIIDTFFERGVEGDLWAGNIVDICPVGALLSKDFLHKARAWDLDGAPSICPNCAQGCNVRIDTRDNLVMRLKPRLNPDVNSYWMCDYGRYRYEWMNAGDRIEAPLVRDGAGKLVPTGWSAAITALVERAGARASASVVASPFHATEDGALAARFAALLSGAPELVYRSERAQDEVVCPGFPRLARRRELAANGRGLEIVGYRRVGDDAGRGGVEEGAHVLIVVGDQLSDQAQTFGQQADLFIYIGHTLTPAARNAHFVLPATTFAEQEGTFVNFEGRVQRFWPALQAPALARPAWQILGVALAGLGDGDAPVHAAQAFARLGELHDEFAGLNYDALGMRGALINSRMKLSAGGAEVR
jgi:NADH-quinone oxidoreductase subunit G